MNDATLRATPPVGARRACRARLGLLALATLAASVGCSTLKTYPGTSRSRAELARIQPAWMSGTEISIHSVDGLALGWLQDRADLLPGSHVVHASLVLRNGLIRQVHEFELPFEAEPGHRYLMFGELSAHGPRMWIAEEEELRTIAEVDRGMAPLPTVAGGPAASAKTVASPGRDTRPKPESSPTRSSNPMSAPAVMPLVGGSSADLGGESAISAWTRRPRR